MPSCALCQSAEAVVFCVNDDASLCGPCDTTYHANPLAARHERRPLACTQKPCASAAGCKSESWDDAAVVPQCSPSTNMFDDLFPLPGNFADSPLDDFSADLLGGAMYALPSGSDLLNFDFDGVVPSMSDPEKEVDIASEPLANTDLLADSIFAPAAEVNPFIHPATNALIHSFMVPQEVIKEEPVVRTVAPKRARVVSRTMDLDFMDDDDSEMEDDSDDGEFVVAPRRSHASRARREAAAAAAVPPPEPELTRAERVARYREKRARRNFKKTIRYQSRKAYAEIRPRIKGRFVSPEEYAAYTKGQQPHFEAEAVVPVC